MKWTPAKFEITKPDGSLLAVTGETSGPFGINAHGKIPSYSLTHLKSGGAIATSLNPRKLKRFAAELLKLDWNFRSVKSRKVKLMAAEVVALRERFIK